MPLTTFIVAAGLQTCMAFGGAWVGRTNEPENGVELKALRRSVNRGQPYGEAKWQATMAKALSLESSLHDPWRPAGKKEGADAKKK